VNQVVLIQIFKQTYHSNHVFNLIEMIQPQRFTFPANYVNKLRRNTICYIKRQPRLASQSKVHYDWH